MAYAIVGRIATASILLILTIPFSDCLYMVSRSRLPGSAKGKKFADPLYAVSMEGLMDFKADLDLVAANCKQFFRKELEHQEDSGVKHVYEEDQIREWLQHADAFQEQVDAQFMKEKKAVEATSVGYF